MAQERAAALPVELVPVQAPVASAQAKQAALKRVEDEILLQAQRTVFDVGFFADINPTLESPPQAWVDELGEEGAWRRFRLANYGLMSAKNAPIGVALAQKTALGIIKARSSEKGGNRVLNIGTVQMLAPPRAYPVIEVESDE